MHPVHSKSAAREEDLQWNKPYMGRLAGTTDAARSAVADRLE